MIYLIALVLGVAVCAQLFASEVVVGNTVHVRNGQEPKAGVAIFPIVPVCQVVELGLVWGLERFAPSLAMSVLLAIHAVLFVTWALGFRQAKAEYSRALAESREVVGRNLSSP